MTRVTNGSTNGSSTKLKPKKSKSPSLLSTNGSQTAAATTQLSPTSTGSSHSTNRQFDIKPELLGTANVNSLQSSQAATLQHHMLGAANQQQAQQSNLQSNLNAQLGQQVQAHNLNNLNNHLNNHNQQMHHLHHQMTSAGQQYHAQHQSMHHSHLNHHGLQSPVQNIANSSQYHHHAASLQNHNAALVAHHHMLGQHQLNAAAAIQQSNQSQLQANYCISPSSRTDSDSPYNGANSTASNSAAGSNGAVQQQSNGGASANQSTQSGAGNGTPTPSGQQTTGSSTPSSNQFTPAVLVKRESPNFSSLHHSFTNSNSNGSSSSNSQALVASSNPSSNSSSNSSISLTAAAIATANAINTSAGSLTPNDTQTSSLLPATSAHHHPITSLHPAVYNMAANANAAVFNHQAYGQSTADQLAFDRQLAYSQHTGSLWPLNQSVSDLVNNNNCIQNRMPWPLESNYTTL